MAVKAVIWPYSDVLRAAGVFVAGEPLQPTATATTVRVEAGGATSVLDGPFADTKEQLGGFYLDELPDMDAPITWAARCPCAGHGTDEVRPVLAVPAPA